MKKTPVIAIVGPTASGKSALSMRIAESLGGEIVCMDSMQIYRGMDIGTAKPTPAERAGIPHHLLDIVEPTQPFSVADYDEIAETVLQEIGNRGKPPILVGGTGLYLKTLLQGMPLGGTHSDAAIRDRFWRMATEPGGKERVHALLTEVDPQTAARLHPNDFRRVIRALEVYEVSGIPLSRQNTVLPERPFDFCLIGTTMERELLYARIHQRADAMLEEGLLAEIEALLKSGVPPEAQAMQGIGYKELIPVVQGAMPLAEGVELLRQNTRRYAKRQWTWFRGMEGIGWFDMSVENAQDDALALVRRFWDTHTGKGESPCP